MLHDYGMGGLWRWIHARSAQEIAETFAEVEVVDDPDRVAQFAEEELVEVDINSADMPLGLDGLRKQRAAQRGHPDFGALAALEVVYLRRPWDDADDTEPCLYFEELGPDGRRLRQVEVYRNGSAIRTTPDDWPLNPPIDLYDPDLPQWQTDSKDFDQAWHHAKNLT
ncbi:hypothetical protein M1L60_12740 [Actinoplanes sp. TRM 88003]|uniref:Uncharacterized protein n=1 Tax=Paractinoplanes aksuensis TaxID=2939490 RepID=A0ABT1DKU0_9ACTN|nr:hypothetical protein [Actinoplanes aksuensis]MCO8271463.1 hypothetical protein [Actinoplanes aksuensis]